MAEAQLQQFLEKVRQLNAFVALSEAEPALLQALRDCSDHHAVVELARSRGFEIG
ncbi:MAG: Nif11-like leader peptide family natural product precursor, partial [Cyanobium sp. MAG_237]|nr:Nif11-like leader peptide family natural product precursor [Cyanobium sp. MAG_237]